MEEKVKIIPKIRGQYKISDKNLIEIMNNNPGKSFSKLIIDVRLDSLDISLVVKLLNEASCICYNYEDVLYINELVKRGLIKIGSIYLEDDLEMKDRSYIDFSEISSLRLLIPENYYMWGVKNIDASKSNITQKTIDEVRRIVSMFSEFPEKLTDVEKIIILVNYVQNYCEYIDSKIDILNRTSEQFELKENPKDEREVIKKLCHLGFWQVGTTIDEPLFENYATCTGFAKLMVLLLNNPFIKIRSQVINGDGHAWNLVLLNDKLYNLDVTRSITYSPYRAKNNLKTLKFNEGYILVGTDFLEKDGHEKRTSKLLYPYEESKEDFDHDYINTAIEYLKNTGLVQFEYDNNSMYFREYTPLKK